MKADPGLVSEWRQLQSIDNKKTHEKIISFMHILLDGFVACPNGEMNRIKVDEEIFDHMCNRSVHCPPLAGEVLRFKSICKLGGGQ